MNVFEEALDIKNKIIRGDVNIGILAPTEVERMQELFIKAGEGGNPKAWFELAKCYESGLIYHEEAAYKAAEHYKKAAEAGYGIVAWRKYIQVCYFCNPTAIRPETVKDVLEAHLHEDETGELALFKGYMLLKGYGYQIDELASSEAILLATKKGNVEAMFEMYIYYHFGYGVQKNEDTAIQWCLQAAENGNTRALYNMGTMYASGYGAIKPAMDKAVKWYEKASEAGHGKAAATLALMYVQGTEVAKDLDKAKYYFQRADENNYGIEAEVMLESEIDIPEDWF